MRLREGQFRFRSHLMENNIAWVFLGRPKSHIVRRAMNDDQARIVSILTLCTKYPDPRDLISHF